MYKLSPPQTHVGGFILVTHHVKNKGSTKRTTYPITQAGLKPTHNQSLTGILPYVLFELSLEEAILISSNRGAVTSSGNTVAEQQNL